MDNYYESLEKCGLRYKRMSCDPFIDVFLDKVRQRFPLMKLNRWLGYIQGTLISEGKTSVEKERDWTRPLFRPLDFINE